MEISLILILIISGVFVGFINTLSAGGTVISIALYLALGLTPSAANATNRIGVLIQSFSTGAMMYKEGLVDNKKVWKLAIPTMLGAFIGSMLAIFLTQTMFVYFMAIILLMMIFFLFFKPSSFTEDNVSIISKPINFIQYFVFFIIGIYGGFIQVGTGFFLMMAGTLLMGYNIIRTNAMKVLIMGCYTVVAVLVFLFDSKIYWTYGLIHSLGGIIGAYLATRFAVRKGADEVRLVIVFVIILTVLNLFGIIDLRIIFENLI